MGSSKNDSPDDGRNLIILWQVVCQAVVDNKVTYDQLGWVDRRVADFPALQVWLHFRERCLHKDPDGDPDEVQALRSLNVKESGTWRQLLKHGFRRTAQQANGVERRDIMRELAAVLHDPDLLSELEVEVFSRDRLPEAWAHIQAEVKPNQS